MTRQSDECFQRQQSAHQSALERGSNSLTLKSERFSRVDRCVVWVSQGLAAAKVGRRRV